jgi:hypothetical protein
MRAGGFRAESTDLNPESEKPLSDREGRPLGEELHNEAEHTRIEANHNQERQSIPM